MVHELEPESSLNAQVSPVDGVVPVALDVDYPVAPYTHDYSAADTTVSARGYDLPCRWLVVVN